MPPPPALLFAIHPLAPLAPSTSPIYRRWSAALSGPLSRRLDALTTRCFIIASTRLNGLRGGTAEGVPRPSHPRPIDVLGGNRGEGRRGMPYLGWRLLREAKSGRLAGTIALPHRRRPREYAVNDMTWGALCLGKGMAGIPSGQSASRRLGDPTAWFVR
jgi:hypothetical protein